MGFIDNRRRSFGFTHSSAEAVQLVRFMAAEIDPPAEIWPLISQSPRDRLRAEKHPPSDVYVVEICSAKELRIGDWLIQLNYLVHRFPRFFADVGRRAAFWRLTELGDQAAFDAFLRAEWSADDTQRAEIAFLRQISLHIATAEDLERDMRWLMATLPRVVFVTHVDALRSDGSPIRTRSALIANVEATARRLEAPVINPTGAMLDWGQTGALEADSPALAHYTEAFSARIGDLLIAEGVSDGLIRAAVTHYDNQAMLLAHLDARRARGNLAHLDPVLNWAIEQRPHWHGLTEWTLRFAVETGRSDRAAALIRDGRLNDLTLQQQMAFASLCAARHEIGLLAMLHDRVPQACAELPYLMRLRLEGAGDAMDLPLPDDILQSAERLHRDGQPRTALALLLEEHPEAKAGRVATPAVIELIMRLASEAAGALAPTDLGALLVLMRRAGLSPSVAAPLQGALNAAALAAVERARASGELAPLAAFVERLGAASDLMPDLHRNLAYQALRARRYDLALPAALAAARLAPADPQAPLFAMRAAAQLHDPFLARAQADRLVELIADPNHTYRQEAESRLQALPRMFYNRAAKIEDPIEAIRHYRAAAGAPDLTPRATKEAAAREKSFLQTARDRLVAGDSSLLADLERARDVLGDHPRLLFLTGRFLVQRGRFADAMPIWQTLVDTNPDDDRARAELDRCLERTA
ncbi:MAG: hypothetical protein K0B00_12865 [Rhodobacteraceae bacterium]|nr:hypothetical protein [Paracoccaceae bacterium]